MSTNVAASPTPVPDDRIAIRVMCWYKDHIAPQVMMVENVRGEELRLGQADWLKALCEAEGNKFIDHWSELHGDWTTNTLTTLVVGTERTTMAVLLRLAHVSYCEGLGVEISLLEQARGRFAFAKLEQFDLTKKNGGRPVKVAVWGENMQDEARVYNVSLSRQQTFTVSSHPALLQQAIGVAGLPSTPALFELWDVYSERWTPKKIGETITVQEGFDLVLIRYQGNSVDIGLGYAVAELQLTRAILEKKTKLATLTAEKNGEGSQEPPKKRARTVRQRSPMVIPPGAVVIDVSD